MRHGALTGYEAALNTGGPLALVSGDGRVIGLAVTRWLAPPDAADETVLARCVGPTLDVGCGPGRFVETLAGRGQLALGVDIAETAVRLTARNGAPALLRSVFDRVPGEGRWPTVLLMDGNIGIDGDPVRLLIRVRELLATGGQVLIEVDPEPDTGEILTVRFSGPGEHPAFGPSFDWALVGAAVLRSYAEPAGYTWSGSWSADGRTFVRLTR